MIKTLVPAILIFIALSTTAAKAEIMITQLMYNPEGSDTGKEWVELYNPGEKDVLLQGYSLESGDGSAENDWSLEWSGTSETIRAKGYFLIGEEFSPVAPDVVSNLDLQNGPDAVRLLRNAVPVDTVGWGEHQFSEYYDGSPAPETGAGEALQRKYSANGSMREYYASHDNSMDFTQSASAPKNSAYGNGASGIELEIEVVEYSAYFVSANITDMDFTRDGIQAAPYPGGIRELDIEAAVKCPAGLQEIGLVDAVLAGSVYEMGFHEEISAGIFSFNATMGIPFFQQPGNYSVEFAAECAGEQIALNKTIEIMPLAALSIDSAFLGFPDARKGAKMIIDGDSSTDTPDFPTLMNIGNSRIDLTISTAGLSSQESSLNISCLSISLAQQGIWHELKEGSKIPLGLYSGEKAALSFMLDVPEDAIPGLYRGSLLVSAVRS